MFGYIVNWSANLKIDTGFGLPPVGRNAGFVRCKTKAEELFIQCAEENKKVNTITNFIYINYYFIYSQCHLICFVR